jgi:aminoglycoside phosphotransferase (APT) family kinase protein
MDAQLGALVESKRIGLELATRVARVVRERAPARALHGFAHGDFAAENLLVDAQGRLRAVDNEALHVGILDHDLARTCWRWPLPPASWRTFLEAHRGESGRTADPFALHGWKLRTLVLSAWYRDGYGLAGVEEPLAKLRTLLDAAHDPEREGVSW